MAIEAGKVVRFHYSVKEPDGETFETTEGGQPAVYLHGRGSIVPGLENAMRGHDAGDSFTATIAPEHAYGMYDPEAVRRIPIKHLIRPGRLTAGKTVAVNTRRGPARATVLKVGKFNVDLDFNHPHAGKTLVFDVNVIEVRDATSEELAHGHAHGPGGVEH